ncbi:hypothetical protein PR048_021138 [Dryococelus australis]|uniref:Uncharacterized protein n=1 Tax=Dryococelus australis TaxID=614101 RepID=A0ABQ9GXD3_9NEOP|nr:hypothetical protein PR048_021138 [Dryococelus australis]
MSLSTRFVGLKTLNLGVNDDVITFNGGNAGRIRVLEHLGINTGWDTETILQELDKQRVAKAEIVTRNMTEEARSIRRWKRLNLDDTQEDEDCNAGGF